MVGRPSKRRLAAKRAWVTRRERQEGKTCISQVDNSWKFCPHCGTKLN